MGGSSLCTARNGPRCWKMRTSHENVSRRTTTNCCLHIHCFCASVGNFAKQTRKWTIFSKSLCFYLHQELSHIYIPRMHCLLVLNTSLLFKQRVYFAQSLPWISPRNTWGTTNEGYNTPRTWHLVLFLLSGWRHCNWREIVLRVATRSSVNIATTRMDLNTSVRGIESWSQGFLGTLQCWQTMFSRSSSPVGEMHTKWKSRCFKIKTWKTKLIPLRLLFFVRRILTSWRLVGCFEKVPQQLAESVLLKAEKTCFVEYLAHFCMKFPSTEPGINQGICCHPHAFIFRRGVAEESLVEYHQWKWYDSMILPFCQIMAQVDLCLW